jgi:hypothetical protein
MERHITFLIFKIFAMRRAAVSFRSFVCVNDLKISPNQSLELVENF